MRVEGVSGSSRVALEAVIDITEDKLRILQMNDAPFDDMPVRWGWANETTTETPVQGLSS